MTYRFISSARQMSLFLKKNNILPFQRNAYIIAFYKLRIVPKPGRNHYLTKCR